MEHAVMLKVSAALLCFTALGGMAMAVLRSGQGRPPSWLAMAHGLLAGSGLTLLLYAGWAAGLPTLMWVGVAALAFAAAVGIYMNLAFHDKQLPLPVRPMLFHAGVGVVGLALIAIGAFGAPPSVGA